MMSTYRTLSIRAKQSAKWRGHSMSRFRYTLHGKRITGLSECKVCSAYVQIDTRPEPNGIDIGGNAVALNCPIAVKDIR